jgi:hypothetical protein
VLRLRRSSSLLAASLLIAGPAALGFLDGGFFDEPRLIAGSAAWVLVLLAALFAERPLPRQLPGRLALTGLVLLCGWTALSVTWAPLRSPALADAQRLALLSGVLFAAAAWLGDRRSAAAVEPGLALGIVAVVGYGMSERFLPSLIELDHSSLAFGRVEQPLTYWNGMGVLAAMGLVLSTRLAGTPRRPVAMRMAAVACAPLLGAGLLLTLSRGAFAALAVGLLVLLALAPERAQARSLPLAAAAAAAAAVLAALLPGLDVVGSRASSSSGAWMLAATVLLAAGAALVQRRMAAREDDVEPRAPASGRRWKLVAAAGLVVVVAATAAAIGSSRAVPDEGGGTRTERRLDSLESPRYRYWDVAVRAFAEHPVRGLGSAGFRVEWRREPGSAPARDAHSLYLETAAELGVVGLALLGLFVAGLLASTRRAVARRPAASAGPAAVLAAWAFHAGLDWDWELPAVTLPALVCAGLLVALAEPESGGGPPG